MTLFYIWDTRSNDDNALFWRPQGAGYTTNLDEAGRYTAEEIAKRRLEWHQVAIPCDTVDPQSHRCVKIRKLPDRPTEPEHLKAEREAWRKKREAEAYEFDGTNDYVEAHP